MITRRTRLFAAVATAAGLTLSACGGSDGADPTTKSVEDHAKSEAAKSSTTGSPGGSSTEGASASARDGSTTAHPDSSASAPSPSREPLPDEPTNTADAQAAVNLVRTYFTTFNTVAKRPSEVANLDRYTVPSCKSCSSLRELVSGLKKKKERLDGDLVTVTSAVPKRADTAATLWVYISYDQNKVASVDEKDKNTGGSSAKSGIRRAVEVDVSKRKILEMKKLVG